MNNRFIIITSINPPTDAIRSFASWLGWTTVVVGDRKSPRDWHHENVVYLSVEDQINLAPDFAKFLPENTYTRKMMGYLFAFRHGAEAIFESDDDNIPYPNAVDVVNRDLTLGLPVESVLASQTGWVNVYKAFGALEAWPRGFPLHKLAVSSEQFMISEGGLPWGVMQYLADEDPDVDSIYRMTNGKTVYFSREKRISIAQNSFSPFNSQATLWTPAAYPLMFLPLGVHDRITDILRGYIALSCLWKNEMTLGFASPIVFQVRNFHNLLNDFEQEIDLYLHGESWCKGLLGISGGGMAKSFSEALQMLIGNSVLPSQNIAAYTEFLKYISTACSPKTG
jgi:hypothetical protein